MILCADIGNSGIRFAAWRDTKTGGEPHELIWRKSMRKPVDLDRELTGLNSGSIGNIRWGVASVNAPLLEQLQNWVQKIRPTEALKVIRHTDIPLKIDVVQPDAVGIDRLISAWAAWKKDAKHSAIVVDAGSAVTVDLVDVDGRFLGGNIFPGAAVSLRSLFENTDQLPGLSEAEDFPPTPIGKSTADAILSGVFRMQAAAITSLVRELQQHFNVDDSNVVLTGGGIPALQSIMPAWRFDEHLVIDGIRDLLVG